MRKNETSSFDATDNRLKHYNELLHLIKEILQELVERRFTVNRNAVGEIEVII